MAIDGITLDSETADGICVAVLIDAYQGAVERCADVELDTHGLTKATLADYIADKKLLTTLEATISHFTTTAEQRQIFG
jgi:hypothetical protein|tara:strand:- start:1177 stop:1413 length:237 start_codon:yes stop_codon:yes gene_type:complete